MTRLHLGWPSSMLVSLLAALTTWTTLLTWSGFAEVSSGFLLPLFWVCLGIAVTGMLLRSAGLPALVVLMLQLVVVGLWMNHHWAGAESAAGWLPTWDSLRVVRDTLSTAGELANQYASPVPASVTGFYPLPIVIGAVVALLVDFLACGVRRVPLAGLPLLAVYTAPVSLLGDVAAAKFVVAALCLLFLMAADEARRLARWGRPIDGAGRVADTRHQTVTAHSVWPSARRIGFTATAVAVVTPLLLPSFNARLLDGVGAGGDGEGGVSIKNPIVDLQRDLSRGSDIPLVWVTTPDPNPEYLRLTVLDEFDGTTWRPSGREIPGEQRADGDVPLPDGLAPALPRTEVPYEVRVGDAFDSTWLPTPFPVSRVEAPGDWRYDLRTMDFIGGTDDASTAGLSYSLTALDLNPTATALVAASPAPGRIYVTNTALPEEVPKWVTDLARDVTRPGRSRFERAVLLQDWFREDGGFTYSLERAAGNDLQQLETFLGTGPGSRTGYCEQFAAAMAMMARTIGLPARVSVGFLRPDRVGPQTYSYSSHDLHAWPEVYFQGVGWTRFEPTPQARTGAVPAYTTGRIPAPVESTSASASAVVPSTNRADPTTASPGSGAGSDTSTGGWMTALLVLAAGTAALLLSTVPRLVRALVRRRRWADPAPAARAEAAWAELRATAIDLGLPWADQVTLRTRARGLVTGFGRTPGPADDALTAPRERGPAADPEATRALERTVLLLERARYSRSVPVPVGLEEDVARCVAAMRSGASRRSRLWADWLPRSLWRSRSRYSSAVRGEPQPDASSAGTGRVELGQDLLV